MTNNPSIKLIDGVVEGVDVSARANGLRQFLLGRGSLQSVSIPILRNINFSASSGEKIAFVGSNGSGKSSLLKVLANIYPLKSGALHVHGQVAAIIEMGIGFDPELSGRKNIKLALVYSNMLSLYTKELEEEIIEFSELGSKIDLPLKGYSSGMLSRLAFSISMMQHPDILLLDEVFAVGDAHFVEKAKKVMRAKFMKAPIAVLVSHSEEMVKEMCDKAVLLKNGEIVDIDTPTAIYAQYNKI